MTTAPLVGIGRQPLHLHQLGSQRHYQGSFVHRRVVYLDAESRAINEDVVWTGSQWAFAMKGPCGGFADQNSSMVIYVRALRDEADRDK